MLRRGGSAIDAAIAVQAALGVVEPQSSGLGGGSLITYYDVKSRRTRIFDGLSAAGQTVTVGLTVPTAEEKSRYSVTGFASDAVNYSARAVGVPGTLAVLDQVHQLYGELRWNELFDDSVELADRGFPVAPYLYDALTDPSRLTPVCALPDVRALYCHGRTPQPVGTTVRNPELAGVLREVRDGGAAAFYDPHGDIAPAIVAKLRSGSFKATADSHGPAVIPSLLRTADFANYRAVERKPLCTERLGHQLCTTPAPSSGGTTLTNMLGIAEAKGITRFSPDGADYTHLMIEASRVAGVDSRAYVGDPAYDGAPSKNLTSPSYVAQRASLISKDTAVHPVTPGDPDGDGGTEPDIAGGANNSTSQVSIVDARGNALSMTTTVNLSFGAGLFARGIVLNDAQSNFSAAGSPVNEMESGKRPRTSTAPSIAFDKTGRTSLVVGSAGGGPIPDYIAQTYLGVLAYGQTPAQALGRPHISGQTRISHCGGTSDIASDVEAGTAAKGRLSELKKRNAPCARAVELHSGAAAIARSRNGTLNAAADPRRDGTALPIGAG
ncbi:gamma-glutamyltransferase family protein [Streptomyces violascens]|uniref:gamma-glutamyltransferase family protein n=1 Tax=Streptomyces violascens TaxID=67381 RepID=UPI00378788B1